MGQKQFQSKQTIMEGRIIFVGVHNKPGLKPLDSSTRSGKLIDRVANELRHKGKAVLKTNLYDVDYLPEGKEKGELAFDWIERVKLTKDDICVLLGDIVHHDFPLLASVTTIKVPHPASRRHTNHEYIASLLKQLNS